MFQDATKYLIFVGIFMDRGRPTVQTVDTHGFLNLGVAPDLQSWSTTER